MHPHLLKLLVNNRGRGFFKAEAANSDEATIYIYDPIVSDQWEADYWGGITPMMFIKELAGIDANIIHLRINSPGGDVFAARVMQNAIREHKAKFIAHIDGIAASAATFLPMAADETVIAKGGMFMIHKAWSIVLGNADDMRQSADLLDKIDGSIAADYFEKTGQDLQQIMDWMSVETFFTDQEAVDFGFVDRITETAPKNQIAWDLSAYDHAPTPKASKIDENSQKTEQIDENPTKNAQNHPKNRPKYREFMPA